MVVGGSAFHVVQPLGGLLCKQINCRRAKHTEHCRPASTGHNLMRFVTVLDKLAAPTSLRLLAGSRG